MIAWVLGWSLLAQDPLTVFLDFDGGALTHGEDAAQGQVSCVEGSVEYPAYLGTAAEAAVITDAVRVAFEPFGIRVVDQAPPPYLPRTTVMIGGHSAPLGVADGVNGLACRVDCDDAVPYETVFVFSETIASASAVGAIAAHEVGHSLGLEHVDGAMFVMNGVSTEGGRAFGDSCAPLSERTPTCVSTHAQHCEGMAQDATAELLAVLGPSGAADMPPAIVVHEPVPGAVVVAGTEVVVDIEVTDDHEGVGWQLREDGLQWERTMTGSAEPVALQFPEGEFVVVVEAMDQSGQVTTVEIPVSATRDGRPPPSGGEDTGDDATTSTPMTADGDTDADPTAREDDAGCRIQATGTPAPIWLAMSLGWLAVRRRRYAR